MGDMDKPPVYTDDIHILPTSSASRLKFNIGGTVFETTEETLDNLQLGQDHDHAKHFKLSKEYRQQLKEDYFIDGEYFFDRDPEIFRYVLNFVRTGKLHVPAGLCASQVSEELKFWGLHISDMENCCWKNFFDWKSTDASLKNMEKSLKIHSNCKVTAAQQLHKHSRWNSLWDVLMNKRTGKAKIYGWISLLFALVSIFSFCVSTHPAFREPLQEPSTNMTSPDSMETNMTSLSSTTTTDPTVEDRLTETEPLDALWYLDLVCLVFFAADLVLKVISGLFKDVSGSNSGLIVYTTSTEKLESKRSESEGVIEPFNNITPIDPYCALCKIRNPQPSKMMANKGDSWSWRRCQARTYLLSFGGVVDLLAIVPDIIMLAARYSASADVRLVLPVLRLMRVFRIFRLFRYFSALWIMAYTLKASWKDLFLMIICLCSGMLIFASLVFFADDKEMFPSIPHGFWWAVITMTTVGYGDMYPVTGWGYLVGSVAAVSGVLVIGFSVPALINNFDLYHTHVKLLHEKRHQRYEISNVNVNGNKNNNNNINKNKKRKE